jgi:predicted oxidoreductase
MAMASLEQVTLQWSSKSPLVLQSVVGTSGLSRLVNTQPAAVEAFRQEFMKTSECRRLELSCR